MGSRCNLLLTHGLLLAALLLGAASAARQEPGRSLLTAANITLLVGGATVVLPLALASNATGSSSIASLNATSSFNATGFNATGFNATSAANITSNSSLGNATSSTAAPAVEPLLRIDEDDSSGSGAPPGEQQEGPQVSAFDRSLDSIQGAASEAASKIQDAANEAAKSVLDLMRRAGEKVTDFFAG